MCVVTASTGARQHAEHHLQGGSQHRQGQDNTRHPALGPCCCTTTAAAQVHKGVACGLEASVADGVAVGT